jgi:hypothetical protein
MFMSVWRNRRPILVFGGLAVFVFGGWTGFIYSAVSSSNEIAQLRTERDAAVADYARLAKTSGELNEVTVKLSRAKAEYDRTAMAWAEVKQKLTAAQQDLASAGRRPDARLDSISHTGSVPQPPKSPARKTN